MNMKRFNGSKRERVTFFYLLLTQVGSYCPDALSIEQLKRTYFGLSKCKFQEKKRECVREFYYVILLSLGSLQKGVL